MAGQKVRKTIGWPDFNITLTNDENVQGIAIIFFSLVLAAGITAPGHGFGVGGNRFEIIGFDFVILLLGYSYSFEMHLFKPKQWIENYER